MTNEAVKQNHRNVDKTGFSGLLDTADYFSAHLTNDPAKEPIAVGESIPRIIADAANKLGRDRKDFSVERITTEHYRTLSQFLSS